MSLIVLLDSVDNNFVLWSVFRCYPVMPRLAWMGI